MGVYTGVMLTPEPSSALRRLANLTIEQLQRERCYWQAQDCDPQQAATRRESQARIAEVEVELESRISPA
jgi:hypothetical protein